MIRIGATLLAGDLIRQWRDMLARLMWAALGTGALVAFVAVLPAYRSSYTGMLEAAAFDQWVSGSITQSDVDTLSRQPGITRAVPLLNVPAVGDHGTSRWSAGVWGIDDPGDADVTIFAPTRLVSGSIDLGTADHPAAVVDQQLARELGLTVGDRFTVTIFAAAPLELRVAGVVAPVFRLRGEGLLVRRAVVLPLLAEQPDLASIAYSDVLLDGVVAQATLDEIFGKERTVAYSKEELLASQESQIEVSTSVIEVISRLAAVALLALLALLAWLAVERRHMLLRLLPHLGASGAQSLAVILILEALPTAVVAGLATAAGLVLIVNGFFGSIGAFVPPFTVLIAAIATGGAVLIFHVAALAAFMVAGRWR